MEEKNLENLENILVLLEERKIYRYDFDGCCLLNMYNDIKDRYKKQSNKEPKPFDETDHEKILSLTDKSLRFDFVKKFYDYCGVVAKNNNAKIKILNDTLFYNCINNNIDDFSRETTIKFLVEEFGLDINKENKEFGIKPIDIIKNLKLNEDNEKESLYDYFLSNSSKITQKNLNEIKESHEQDLDDYIFDILNQKEDEKKVQKNTEENSNIETQNNQNNQNNEQQDDQNNQNNKQNTIMTPLDDSENEDFTPGKGGCTCILI